MSGHGADVDAAIAELHTKMQKAQAAHEHAEEHCRESVAGADAARAIDFAAAEKTGIGAPELQKMSGAEINALADELEQGLTQQYGKIGTAWSDTLIAPWGGGEEGGWAEEALAQLGASEALLRGKVASEGEGRAAEHEDTGDQARVAAAAAALREAAEERGRRREKMWTARRVLLAPGARSVMRLLVCPRLEEHQMLVSLTWNPASVIVLRMTVSTPWGKRVSHLSPHSVKTVINAQSSDLSTDLESQSTQPRVVMGWDDAVAGGPVLASCWSHPTTGHFKISVSLAQKGSTKGEMDAAKRASSRNSDIFFKACAFNNNFVEKAAATEGTAGEGGIRDIQDARIQMQVQVWSSGAGLQTFIPDRDGFFRGSVWNTCILSSEKGLAVAFQDGGAHVELIEDALTCVCVCVCVFLKTLRLVCVCLSE